MTQSTNLKLDLLSATDLFDTDKIKSNFEKIDNTVLIPTKIIDNCVTDNSLLPLSAKQGKLLQDQITKLNGDLGYYITSVDDFSHTLIGEVRKNITLNSKITLGQYTRVLFMNIPNSKDGALLAIAPGNKIITAFRNNGVWEENSSHFIATKSDLDLKASITPGYTPFEFRYDNRYPNVLYIHNLETDELYYAELTKNK